MATARGVAPAVVLTLALATGCGSSGGPNGAATGTAPAGPATSQPAMPGSSTPAAQRPLDAADKRQITKVYETFFAARTTVAVAVSIVQNGDKLRSALAKQAGSSSAQSLSAKVTKVERDPTNVNPDVAVATFTLLDNGKAVLPDTPGYAVRVDGAWKVAAGTVCQLLSLQNSAPPACSDSTITAFPTG